MGVNMQRAALLAARPSPREERRMVNRMASLDAQRFYHRARAQRQAELDLAELRGVDGELLRGWQRELASADDTCDDLAPLVCFDVVGHRE